MAKAHGTSGWLVGVLGLWGAGVAAAADPPSVAQMLSFRPQQEGIVCTTPTAAEQKDCKVKLEQGRVRGASGWLLVDGKGQPLRRFFDSDGDKHIDQWSYFKDGIEVYREIDTKKTQKPDQFRWLNAAGSKWGVDSNGDRKIDNWKTISAEEAAQEAFQAVATRDFARLRAVMISDVEVNALKLPAPQAKRLRETLVAAQNKFVDTTKKLQQVDSRALFVRVESGPPQCIPADTTGPDQDVFQYASRAILYEVGDKDKKHDWLHTGPMVLVGQAWRLVDAPAPGDGTESSLDPKLDAKIDNIDPELRKLLDHLSKHDEKQPSPADKVAVVRFNLERAELCKQIAGRAKADDRENWFKQAADSLNSAAQNSGLKDRAAIQQLTILREQVSRTPSPGNLTAYIVYREIWAELGPRMSPINEDRADIEKAHEKMHERLLDYVKQYPKAEDTPDAFWQLATNCEFSGKEEKEDEAKRWYKMIAEQFPQHTLAARAAGAARRLNLVGQPMDLAGKTLNGTTFNVASLKGKVVVVYYWASYGEPAEDFKMLTKIRDKHAKDVELVTVNLDESDADARRALQKMPMSAPHLFDGTADGSGLNSGLATYYGIQGIPTVFLIGKDGRVLNRTVQIVDLEREIAKALR